MIRKCLKKAAALAAALMMALMFIPAGAYAVYAADAGNTVVVGVNADYGISAVGGNYTGYAFDFLREIQKRSDLTFTFVEGTASRVGFKDSKGRGRRYPLRKLTGAKRMAGYDLCGRPRRTHPPIPHEPSAHDKVHRDIYSG